jgi:hypothetical protein
MIAELISSSNAATFLSLLALGLPFFVFRKDI